MSLNLRCRLCLNPAKSNGLCGRHLKERAWANSKRKKDLSKIDWVSLRKKVFTQKGNICYMPNCQKVATEVDHVNPGNDHSIKNLEPICKDCHKTKSGKEGWSASIGKQVLTNPAKAYRG